jgi:hypothetical protein
MYSRRGASKDESAPLHHALLLVRRMGHDGCLWHRIFLVAGLLLGLRRHVPRRFLGHDVGKVDIPIVRLELHPVAAQLQRAARARTRRQNGESSLQPYSRDRWEWEASSIE